MVFRAGRRSGVPVWQMMRSGTDPRQAGKDFQTGFWKCGQALRRSSYQWALDNGHKINKITKSIIIDIINHQYLSHSITAHQSSVHKVFKIIIKLT
jgi:hypothetical protein